ncbi:hypothetical protein NM208_g1039 [Fusarium decemcellulare]|uniref:Uncharacterized protein n=2 Tax=Fusarium decemcellulare TaxID=57161 RepID=A0ACC1SY38_9HYPO|nr:hypothetical protein NM208_g7671 [Fusarium decemcellulare]KAJ3548380.1 hypothetical protein NM208_g1039 [Fusarium decemcellulare]
MTNPKLRAKTGCFTCRKRRVKCGEEKPSCRNCSAFGRQCVWPSLMDLRDRRHRARTNQDSYSSGPSEEVQPQPLSGKDHKALVSHRTMSPALCRTPFQAGIESELLSHLFNYWFSIIVLPTSSSEYIKQSQSELVDMMLQCQSVKHAVLACCASNKHVLLNDNHYQRIALQYYSKAVRELNQTLIKFQPGSKRPNSSLLTTVIFLYVYDLWCLDASVDPRNHVSGAVKLLDLLCQDGPSPISMTQGFNRIIVESILYQAFLLSTRRPFAPYFHVDTQFITRAEGLLVPRSNRDPLYATSSPVLGIPISLYRLQMSIINFHNSPTEQSPERLALFRSEMNYWEALILPRDAPRLTSIFAAHTFDLVILATSLLLDLVSESFTYQLPIELLSISTNTQRSRWQVDLCLGILRQPQDVDKWTRCFLGAWPLLILGYAVNSEEDMAVIQRTLGQMRRRIGYVAGMSFHYEELPNNRSFRVFVLEPGQENDSLQGRLETYVFDNAPPYEALSYTWGAPDRNRSMRCNDLDFPITESLDVALRRLRYFDKPRIIWIDQICINQDNLEERSQQVGVMRNIYSGAHIVNAWLGPDPLDEAKLVADVVHRMAMLCLQGVDLVSSTFPSNEELQRLRLPARDSPAWTAFNRLLKLPYFTRVWIIQEIAVAEDFQILWGESVIPGRQFRLVHDWGFRNGFFRQDASISSPSPSLDLSNSMVLVERSQDWMQLMVATRGYESTDKRDRIFALIGLVEDTQRGIVADYNKSDKEVYTELASHLISRTNKLDVLSYAGLHDASTVECPFWAPIWTDSEIGSFIDFEFCATRNRDVIRETKSTFEVLALKGFNIDSLKLVGKTPLGSSFSQIMDSFGMMMGENELVQNMYGCNLISPLILTLAAGRSVDDDSFPCIGSGDSHLDQFAGYAANCIFLELIKDSPDSACLRKTIDIIRQTTESRADKAPQAPFFQDASTEAWFRERLSSLDLGNGNFDFVTRSLETLRTVSGAAFESKRKFQWLYEVRSAAERKFFITQTGYMGIGPPCMEPKDIICALFGGSTPYVIRPASTEGEYLFVGECYVHGLMDGEALDMHERGELTEQWFSLK